MALYWWIRIFLLLLIEWQSDGALVPGPETCSDEQLKKCADNAEPLYKGPELVVPDNSKSVNKVCSLWNELTSCIKSYTSRCMTRQQKSEFDKAFKDPIVSMSTLCQDQDYRKEYLHHAPCVKKISTQGTYCGNQYRYLIDLVSGGSANIKQICCARAKFRSCILQKTPDKCDARVSQFNTNSGCSSSPGRYKSSSDSNNKAGFNATTLALSTLDKSLSIVAQQCSSLSSFRETECPGIDQSSTWRGTNKGPRVSPEFLDSAESSNGELTQSTHFQLDQPRPSKYGSQEGTGTMQTPSRATTMQGVQNGNEKPKTDKLSSGGQSSGSARSNNPHKRGSEYDDPGNGALGNILGKQSGCYLVWSMGLLFSIKYFVDP